jgi:DDE family transposase
LGGVEEGQPVGEKGKQSFQLSFNSSVMVDFQGAGVTSDGGLILVRELDERLGLSELMERHLTDSRRGKNTQLPLADLLRQSVYSRLAGYEDVNDAERLSQDPTFRLIGSRKIWERGAALTSRLQSFETEVLTQADNLAGLAALNRELIARAEAINCPRRVVLDMDSTEIPVYGEQEQSAYNGGELFPRVGFIVTSLAASSRAVVRFYNKRGTAEQWIKEGKQAVAMTRLSCHRFRANEVRLWLSLIAYNLGNLWRRLVLPARIDGWSRTSLQQRLVKTGGRLIKHARYCWLLLAESYLTRQLFGSMLRRIAALPSPAG